MEYELKTSSFEPHPEGSFKGTIIEVKNMGKRDTKYGTTHRIAIVIQNDELEKGDGQPWQHDLQLGILERGGFPKPIYYAHSLKQIIITKGPRSDPLYTAKNGKSFFLLVQI